MAEWYTTIKLVRAPFRIHERNFRLHETRYHRVDGIAADAEASRALLMH